MTNDTNTLNGALQELGETLANNLVAMGVTDAEASDGLTTLAGKVLDITPTLTGVDLITDISCNLSEQEIDIEETANITGILTATYDDTTNTNVDLNGYLQGANIKIYENNTLIDTVTTNARGEYTSTYLPTAPGTFNIHSVFDGTDDYSSCISNNTQITIEELLKYGFNNVTPFVAFSGRNTTYTSLNNNQLTQTSGNKGGCHSKNPIFETEADYTISFKIVESTLTVSNGVRIGIHSANYSSHYETACLGIGYTGNSTLNKITFDYSDTNVTAVTKDETNLTSLNPGDIIKFVIIDDTFSAYINDTLYTSATLSWLHDPIWLYCQSWGQGTASMTITNFKVKQHKDSLVLVSNKDILSIYDNETATLTATYKEKGIRVANKNIIFKTEDTILDTITTNNNGEASYIYTVNNDGNITISAEYNSLSETCIIQNYYRYDNATSDKSSGYVFANNPNNSTITYDSTNNCYNYSYPSKTSESNATALYILENYNGSDVEVSIDVKYTFSGPKQMVLYNYNENQEWNNHSPIGTWTSNCVVGSVINGSTSNRANPTSALSSGIWYTLKFKIQGNNIETIILNTNDTIFASKSTSAWNRTKINSRLHLSDNISTCQFKNVKVKIL